MEAVVDSVEGRTAGPDQAGAGGALCGVPGAGTHMVRMHIANTILEDKVKELV